MWTVQTFRSSTKMLSIKMLLRIQTKIKKIFKIINKIFQLLNFSNFTNYTKFWINYRVQSIVTTLSTLQRNEAAVLRNIIEHFTNQPIILIYKSYGIWHIYIFFFFFFLLKYLNFIPQQIWLWDCFYFILFFFHYF